MQVFVQTHKYLIESLDTPINRSLMDDIDWNAPLIGIRGARGIGKTSFLLAYAKKQYKESDKCLYINLNNFYFTSRTIVSFAEEFYQSGGRSLLLDQVYKYPNWAEEVQKCRTQFADLQIVFTTSLEMNAPNDDEFIVKNAQIYTLEGFSFREYLNYKTGQDFRSYTLKEIIANHTTIAQEINLLCDPLTYYKEYLHRGYYPFLLNKKRNYLETLLKIVNFTLEIDVSSQRQVELKYLPKLRKLLYQVAIMAPFQPNISKLSEEIETSRATVMNYLQYLSDASLVHLFFSNRTEIAKKPEMIYLYNPNLAYAVFRGDGHPGSLNKTFFINQLKHKNKVELDRNKYFIVNGTTPFTIEESANESTKNQNRYRAIDGIDIGKDKSIPLWLFGFLY